MEPSRISPEQLLQAVAKNLPTFEAIMNYLKGRDGDRYDQNPKTQKEGGEESSESET